MRATREWKAIFFSGLYVFQWWSASSRGVTVGAFVSYHLRLDTTVDMQADIV